jgi:hypothetical protein
LAEHIVSIAPQSTIIITAIRTTNAPDITITA